jgi:hypothetical protein
LPEGSFFSEGPFYLKELFIWGFPAVLKGFKMLTIYPPLGFPVALVLL